MRARAPAVALAAIVLAPAAATAADYPPATDPGKGPRNPPRGGTLKVCKKGCPYKRIQAAIDTAGRGTTIRVGRGTYREGLKVLSPKKDGIRLIGTRVVLTGRPRTPNGVLVNNADGVTVQGFTARDFKDNGFLVVNADGYKLAHVVAERSGAHGVYALNAKGGEVSASEAYYHRQAGFSVDRTREQTRPKRTLLRGVTAWGNAAGYTGDGSRYVTIAGSRFFNNAAGIADRGEDTAIVDNDVFWNNFDYYAAAPFQPQPAAAAPPGTGLLLHGARTTTVEGNRVWGNWLVGYAGLDLLDGNTVRGNRFGLDGGVDTNGRDLLYDGSGSGNCFEQNATQSPNVPADDSAFSACGQPNSQNRSARDEAAAWSADGSHESFWVRSDHRPIGGITPLERWTAGYPQPAVRR